MKTAIIVAVILLAFLPVEANKPGRMQELEARVQHLENKLQDYEMMKVEVACLESYVNFILSDEYVDWLLSQL